MANVKQRMRANPIPSISYAGAVAVKMPVSEIPGDFVKTPLGDP
jgi:hypothetical protein